MKIESHLENLRESFRKIEQGIKEGLQENQRTIGFHTSAAAMDMLEIILHKNNLIDPGFMVKHEWFNSKNIINQKFDFEFPKKKEMLQLTANIESFRNKLCYGKRQDEAVLESLIKDFLKLKKIFQEAGEYEL